MSSSHRRRSFTNEKTFEQMEKTSISKQRLHNSAEGISQQREPHNTSRDTQELQDFRSRSNTVPTKLPSQGSKFKDIKKARNKVNARISKLGQVNEYSKYERTTTDTAKVPNTYLKPLVKQNKIPADALEDPLASSGRPVTRSSSEKQALMNNQRPMGNDDGGINGMDIFDYSERHTFNNTKRHQRAYSDKDTVTDTSLVGRHNENEEAPSPQEPEQKDSFRPRASTLSPELLRKVRFTRSNSDINNLNADSANRLHNSCDRLPALRTGTDQPLQGILKKPQDTARRIAWTEPLPGIPPIPTVKVSFYDDEDQDSDDDDDPVPSPSRPRARSMFEWETPSQYPKLTLGDTEDVNMTSSGIPAPMPRGSEALTAVLREFQKNDLKPEVRKTDSGNHMTGHVTDSVQEGRRLSGQWLDSVSGMA